VEHAAPCGRRGCLSSARQRGLALISMSNSIQPDLLALVRDPIDQDALIQHVRAAEDGAVVTFDGCVRNHSQGRRTLYLDYEAYESMALGKMREIAAQIHEKFPVHILAIAHRLGRLEIGETSVFIAVSSGHRPAAFDACRFAIDTLKRTVPIWKKEYFEDGAVWADGEIPPAPLETRAAKPAS
jgi:molybdopterin synthase catalytic subunit